MRVAVVGGGAVGLASAVELAEAGAQVTVFDAADAGQASRASAGILGPQSESHGPGPMLDLCVASLRLYEDWARRLGDIGYLRCGSLQVGLDAEARARTVAWQRAAGLAVEERADALFYPEEGCVQPRLLLAALHAACERRGVTLRRERVARLDHLDADRVVVAAGAWARALTGVAVEPVRGELMLLDAPAPPHVVFGPGGYLVPRAGKMLVGATVERVGFDARTTEAGFERLRAIARALGAPGAKVLDHWAGLRPGSPDELPVFDRLPSGAVAALGHYRNGILLAPISARIVAALVFERTPPVDLPPFSLVRAANVGPAI